MKMVSKSRKEKTWLPLISFLLATGQLFAYQSLLKANEIPINIADRRDGKHGKIFAQVPSTDLLFGNPTSESSGTVIDNSVNPPTAIDRELEELLQERLVAPEADDGEIREIDDLEGSDSAVDPESDVLDGQNLGTDPDSSGYMQWVSPERVNPTATTFLWDGARLSHLSDWEAFSQVPFGDSVVRDVNFSAFKRISSNVWSGTSPDNVRVTEFSGNYFKIGTATQTRTVETTVNTPGTLSGFRLALTLTGNCDGINPDAETGDICSYLIPLEFEGFDERLIPTGVSPNPDKIQFGEVVPPENLAAIQEEGFNDGNTGINIDVPNTGFFPDESRNANTRRFEESDNIVTLGFANVRQVLKQNEREAALGRTIRAVNYISGDEDVEIDLVAQLVTQFLPDAIPELEGGELPPNPRVNTNVFAAANNARVPGGSFTWYQAGISRGESLPELEEGQSRKPEDIPAATYKGVWLGLTPVIDRNLVTLANGDVFVDIGEPFVLNGLEFLAEGGLNSNPFGDNVNIVFDSIVNGERFTASSADVLNSYSQIYLAFLGRDANAVNKVRYTETTNFIPHISFMGNITNAQSVFNYYTGAMLDYSGNESGQNLMAYAGLDYRYLNKEQRLAAGIGAIGYLNPDRDYYSRLWGNVSKTFSLSGDPAIANPNLTFGVSFNYAIDQEDKIPVDGLDEDLFSDPNGSNLILSVASRIGNTVLGLEQNIGGFLPNSDDNRMVLRATSKLSDTIDISGYYTPYDDGFEAFSGGMSLGFRLGNNYNSPRLTFGWDRVTYKFATNDFVDNRYAITFRVGQPNNPFRNQ